MAAAPAPPVPDCDADVVVMEDWMKSLHVKTDGAVERTTELIRAAVKVFSALETHVVAFPGMAYGKRVPSREAMLMFWRTAHDHHVRAPEGNHMTVLELVWLTYMFGWAATNPAACGADACASATIESASLALRRACQSWPATVRSPADVIAAEWKAAVAFTLYSVSHGVSFALAQPADEKRALAVRDAEYKYVQRPVGAAAGAPEPPKREATPQEKEIARAAANTRASIAYRDWLPLCVRYFGAADYCNMLFEWYPPVDAPESPPPEYTLCATRVKAFLAKQGEIGASEDLSRRMQALAFEAVMPLGATMHHMRCDTAAKADAREVYRAECGDDPTNEMSKRAALVRVATVVAPPTPDAPGVGVPAAFWLCQYDHWLGQRVDGVAFLDRYVVLGTQMRERDAIIHATRREGRPRTPLILQIGAHFYFHDTPTMVRCASALDAICMWTYHLVARARGQFDTGHDGWSRWAATFAPAPAAVV